MSTETIDNKRATLLSHLDELNRTEKLLLQILAVAAEPLNIDMVLLLLGRIRLSDAEAGTDIPTLLTLKPLLQRLRKLELIGSNSLINPLLVDVLVRNIFADTTTKVVLQQATQAWPRALCRRCVPCCPPPDTSTRSRAAN